jgi:ADP-ribosylglycohydrolase
MYERYLAMLHGVAVGDALGLPYEHVGNHPTADAQGNCIAQPNGCKQWGSIVPHTYPCGQISDDTEMTIALLRAMRVEQEDLVYDVHSAIEQYRRWAATQCPFMGRNTRNCFVSAHPRADMRAKSLSNGALMRCAPLALLSDIKARDAVIADCSLTNPALECVTAELFYVRILRALLRATSPARRERANIVADCWQMYPQCTQYPLLVRAYEDAMGARTRDLAENKGLYTHSLYCAIYCITQFDTMTHALNWVIFAPGRTDTDTNAAIAGAAMGAFLGPLNDEIYVRNLHDVLTSSPRGRNTARPSDYHPICISALLRERMI